MGHVDRVVDVAKAVPDYPGREAWNRLLEPLVEPLARRYAGHNVVRLVGFATLWHAYGGTKEFIDGGVLSRASVYRMASEFHAVFGYPVEDFDPSKMKPKARRG